MHKRIAVLVMFAACGDGDHAPDAQSVDAPSQSGSCGATGSGSVTGTVAGEGVDPVVRAHRITIGGDPGHAIVLDEQPGACGAFVATGEHLALLFCAAPTAGTYPVVGEQAFTCPGSNAFGLMEKDGPTDFAESVGGSITITSATSTCVAGSFTLSMRPAEGAGDPEPLTGTFDAVICP